MEFTKKILFINDLDDISCKKITHFSLDKALYLAYGMAHEKQTVYFLTTGKPFDENDIHYVNINDINIKFIKNMDLIIIVREGIIPSIIQGIPSFKEYLLKKDGNTKIMIKSDSVQWICDKSFTSYISESFGILSNVSSIVKWTLEHFDYICVQTTEFKNDARKLGIPENMIIMSNMAIPHMVANIDFDNLENPYDVQHSYCVQTKDKLGESKALLPLYYCDNSMGQFNTPKKIIIYMGRVKTDSGKLFFMMRDIMDKLGDEYELHIFPGSFIIPDIVNNTAINCSARNSNHLVMLREKIFSESKNIIIHYPCQHKDIYKYLHHAYCGIDFSEVRPSKSSISKAGHAKILEYCSAGLPVVCENNINNLFLINNAENGTILPYMASVDDYVNAIKLIGNKFVDRKKYRNITFSKENSIIRARQLLDSLQ